MAATSLSMTSREVNGSAMAALLAGGIGAVTLILIALGVFGTFPPVWAL